MQRNYRFLWLALIPLGAVGALATGMVSLPWQLGGEPAVQTESKQAEQPSREAEKPAQQAERPARAQSTENRQAALQPAPPQSLTVKAPSAPFGVDVARISMVGSSVIAGYGEPGSTLTVLADGKPLGVVIADAAGDWVLITSHKFAGLDPSISLKAGDLMRKRIAAVDDGAPSGSEPVAEVTAPAATAAEVTKQMMLRLKKLTREAEAKAAVATRPAASGQVASYRPSPQAPSFRDGVVTGSVGANVAASSPGAPTSTLPTLGAKTPDGAATDARAPVTRATSPAPPSSRPAQRVASATPNEPAQANRPVTDSLPVPVQFVYRKAVLTEQGREAANLLLAYFMAKQFEVVTLSGHADERGTERANHTLSKQRLLRIRDLLRSGGFQGRIELVPKGETEKYQGVDRSLFQPEELYQLDRRVEVMSAR